MIHLVKPPSHVCYVVLLVCKSGGTASACGHTKEEALESAATLKSKFPHSYVWESVPYLAGVSVDPVVGPIWDTSPTARNGYDPKDSMPEWIWELYSKETEGVL